MIKGNIIEFGYGDVLVGACGCGYVEFTNIKPPLKCGQTVYPEMYDELEIGLTVKLYEDEVWDLYHLINTVNKENKIIEFKGYILDFSNYNKESVRVVSDHAYKTVNIMCLAC